MTLPANLTDKQLKVYETTQRIRMAWVALVVILSLFAIGFISFIIAVFVVPGQAAAKTIYAAIDGGLAVAVHIMLKHLFPPKR